MEGPVREQKIEECSRFTLKPELVVYVCYICSDMYIVWLRFLFLSHKRLGTWARVHVVCVVLVGEHSVSKVLWFLKKKCNEP